MQINEKELTYPNFILIILRFIENVVTLQHQPLALHERYASDHHSVVLSGQALCLCLDNALPP